MNTRWLFTIAAVLVGVLCPTASEGAASALMHQRLQQIYAKEEFKPDHFGPVRWTEGGQAFTTLESSTTVADGQDIVRYSAASGERKVIISATDLTPAGETKALKIDDYAWSEDGKSVLIFTNTAPVWRKNTRGDYWLLRLGEKTLTKLGDRKGMEPNEPSTMMYAKLSPDGAQVGFVRHNDLFVQDLQSMAVREMTSDGSPTRINGTSDWVYEEEFGVQDGWRWSPDSRRIAIWKFDSTGVGLYPLVNYTDTIYPVIKQIPYPKAGTTNSAVSIHVVTVDSGATVEIKLEGNPRENYIPRMEWPKGSAEIVILRENRLQNTADLLFGDPRTGSVRQIFRDHDKAWVDVDEIRPSGDGFVWLSDRDGWRHAYFVPRDGGEAQLLTPGKFDVIQLVSTKDRKRGLYFMASPDNATQSYLYRASEAGGKQQVIRITPAGVEGSHAYEISPDEKWAIHRYSRADDPPRGEVITLPDHRQVRSLFDNQGLRAKAKPLLMYKTEFLEVNLGGGVVLDGWMISPAHLDRKRKYPLLVYVYGEPAGQTVMDAWSTRSLFHRALAESGYIVASFDNRGTPAPKGRDWRKVIYGSVGPLAATEQTAAVKKLCEMRTYIDANRVGVWGWSGGGTNTLNLMFRSPEVFKVGMAVAPVPDQRLYDTIYQERYMRLPQENLDGYQRGSAINFATGLRGELLLVHGTGDDNVHFQGSQMLINKLVELGKPFQFMEYPNRTHAISEGKGTSLHLYTLLADYLADHLPAGSANR